MVGMVGRYGRDGDRRRNRSRTCISFTVGFRSGRIQQRVYPRLMIGSLLGVALPFQRINRIKHLHLHSNIFKPVFHVCSLRTGE